MDSLTYDIRQSLRSLRSQPGFVAVAVLSLAVGMGVTTAVFSALNAVLFKPLPVRNIDRTVYVYHSNAERPDRGTSFRAFEHYRNQPGLFERVMAFSGARPLLLGDKSERYQAYGEVVTSDFFAIANIGLQMGRPFDRSADSSSNPPFVTVLSDSLWKRRYASDPTIVGRSILVNDRDFVVAGVAAPGFMGLDPEVVADMWIPLTTWAHLVGEPGRLSGEEHWLTTVAELKAEVDLAKAQAAMTVVGQAVRATADTTKIRSARDRLGAAAVDALALGAGAMAVGLLVLGLACLNITSLLMARAAARQREIAVRLALGSSRARLIRLWLIESVAICAAAGALGLLFASWMIGLVVRFRPPTEIGEAESPLLPIAFQVDLRVLAFALGLSLVTAAIVGLMAGLHASSRKTITNMKTDRASDRRFAPGLNLRSFVIATQMAVSLVLLIPCGLFVRSWAHAADMTPGFDADNVLLLPISATQAGVKVDKPAGFEQQLVESIGALAGVESATIVDPVPLWFGGRFAQYTFNDGSGSRQVLRMGHASVAPGYFATIRLPLLSGRDFTSTDTSSAPLVAIINDTLARSTEASVGQFIRNGDDVMQIVGIARTAKYQTLGEAPQPFLYRPLAQYPSTNVGLSLAVRGTGNSRQLADAVEREVRALVPNWPAFKFRALDEGLHLQRQLPRVGAAALGILGGFGLLLAAMGLYGVMAYVMNQRTHEIGIRFALGASTRSVLSLLITQGMIVCVSGAIAGIALALAGTRFLSDLLFGIGAADPVTYLVVPAVLLTVALIACYLPVRNVSRVNPVEVLRRE